MTMRDQIRGAVRHRQARNDLTAKVEYVKRQRQTREHTCHWPGCEQQIPPAMWGCRPHWYALPAELRAKIWRAYRIGQEKTLSPSREYLAVAREVDAWIKSKLAANRR